MQLKYIGIILVFLSITHLAHAASTKCYPTYIKGIQLMADGRLIYVTTEEIDRLAGNVNNPTGMAMLQLLSPLINQKMRRVYDCPFG